MSKKGNWTVKVKCVVEKELYCQDCTEEEAKSDPFGRSCMETETDQSDWEIIGIKADE